MRVLIATPTLGTMPVEYVRSLESLNRSGVEVECAFVENSLVYDARDKLCKIALDAQADYVLWIDSDMVFSSQALRDLLAHDADAVTGLCFRRRPPYTPAIWERLRLGLDGEREVKEFLEYPENQFFEIDACGMAFCLVKTQVIKTVHERFGTCFQPLSGYGEDISFCIRARQLGYKFHCDSSVKIGHMANTIVTEETYKRLRGGGGIGSTDDLEQG